MRFEISLLALIAAVAYAAPAPIPKAKPADVDNAGVDSVEADKFDVPTYLYVPPKSDKQPTLAFDPKTGGYILISLPDEPKKTSWKREAEPMPAPEAEAEAVAVAPDNLAPKYGYYGRPVFIPGGRQPSSPQYWSSTDVRSSNNQLNGLVNLNDVLNDNTIDLDILK
ncbi:hypothetical protein MPH_11157 [Macrophomina phaseolina MS6]|uniref:Uncharacterized protein n=1 Tax=Macrophomina phaseolina (strain MS6) TaxID=1126212 RepID=K2RN95_MACPH|nr:hypothetical protein MPH_11157 [Macrophomina phaseolina MS6]